MENDFDIFHLQLPGQIFWRPVSSQLGFLANPDLGEALGKTKVPKLGFVVII